MSMHSTVSRLAILAAGLTVAAGSAMADTLSLDTITVLVTRTEVKAIESLAGVSVIGADQIKEIDPARLQDIFQSVPSVWANTRSDDPGIGFNIRGLQDFGRVAVIVDGARQNFLVAQHGPQGKTYLDPALVSDVEVSRGPVSNIYGSGAIGGVISMKTKDTDDVLRDGDRFGVLFDATAGTNEGPIQASTFVAGRPNPNFDFMFGGSLKRLFDYKDGDGNEIANSGSDTGSALAKATFRTDNGQQLKFGYMAQRYKFDSGDPGDPALLGDGGTDYGNVVTTQTFTGKYNYKSPDNPLLDFELSGFLAKTKQETTVKEQYAYCLFEDDDEDGVAIPTTFPVCPPVGPFTNPALDFTGPEGTTSGYDLTTYGFDTHNNAKFDAYGWNNTLTLGGDYFSDDMQSSSSSSAPDAAFRMTGSGTRQAYGAFAQLLAERGEWLDVIGALRYDGFNLASDDTGNKSEGSRISPKLTVGVTPFKGFTVYGTYAEGYRAPTVVEAFAAGEHPGRIFLFLPNPDLKPETGRTLEAGVNLNYSNVIATNDAFRLKAGVFRNNLTNYIGLEQVDPADGCSFPDGALAVFGEDVCYQYQNTPHARIDGVELEGTYDAGDWFVMASGSINKGKDLDTGEKLPDVLAGKSFVSAGMRFFDRKLTVAPTWSYFSGGSYSTSDGGTVTYDPYNLLGLTVGWQPTEDVRAALVFNNILNAEYTPYYENNAGPGFSVKGTLSVRLGMK
jgi:hemoglobin/transferrin/lactoferrin receptor protein